MEPNLTLALGASSVTPQELTAAYGVYAAGGYRVTPYFITKVTDRDGTMLEETPTPTLAVFANNTSAVKITMTGSSEEAGNATGSHAGVREADRQPFRHSRRRSRSFRLKSPISSPT